MREKVVLFATDYSEASKHALEFACQLARDLQGRLVIAHVSEHELYPVGEASGGKAEASPQELAELRAVQPIYPDLPCTHELLYAPPTCATVRPEEEIVRCADQVDAYAIVVGTHGRTGLKRVLLGSSAEYLIRLSKRPVVVVRNPDWLDDAPPEED